MEHKDMVGKIFKNNAGLEFKVNKFLYKKKNAYYFEIQFIESGSIRKAIKWNIINGGVRDIYHRNRGLQVHQLLLNKLQKVYLCFPYLF